MPFGRNNTGRHGYPQSKERPGPQGPEQHANGDHVGEIAYKSADAGMGKIAEQRIIEGKHDGLPEG